MSIQIIRNSQSKQYQKDNEEGEFQINISNINQFREILYKLQDNNLLQVEILKKTHFKFCIRIVQIQTCIKKIDVKKCLVCFLQNSL
ncbi:unnamed protein product [Paramecium pentaurelia]|uniref:Uncharacterized protein n=1 Tax=Paramecium pentaurelia TaxID=43138 RepID=A0A8S1XPB4_9CILI|nr:unnamed protein product [Paramecium pentaurelia]